MAIKVINGKQALGKRLKVELKKGGMGPPYLPTATPSRERYTSSHKGGGNGGQRSSTSRNSSTNQTRFSSSN